MVDFKQQVCIIVTFTKAANMFKILLLAVALSSQISYADPDEKETQEFCTALSKIYSNAAQSAINGIDYTDLLYSYYTNYEGSKEGMYVIFQAVKRAYTNTKLHNVKPEIGTEMEYNNCLYSDDDIIDQPKSTPQPGKPTRDKKVKGKGKKMMA